MTTLINCASTDPLGYPAYYRAVYTRWPIIESDQLWRAVAKILDALGSSQLVTALNDPTPMPDARSTVLNVQTLDSAGALSVAHLANELRVRNVALGVLPDVGITFKSLERISAGDAFDKGASDAVIARADAENPLGSLEHILELILVLVVIGLVAYGAQRVTRAFRER